VRLVQATLVGETDLNRYFEIMNTRGQQLEQVDIVQGSPHAAPRGRFGGTGLLRVAGTPAVTWTPTFR